MASPDELADEARSLFRSGDYQAALTKFTECYTQGDPTFRTLIQNNMSLCYLRLGMYDNAAQSARNVLQAEPANTKAHYRLAAALQGSDNVMTTLQHAMFPLASRHPASEPTNPQTLSLFEYVHARALQFQKLQWQKNESSKELRINPAKISECIVPTSPSHIHLATTSQDINNVIHPLVASSPDQHVVFILPGSYTEVQQLKHLNQGKFWFIALGEVYIHTPMRQLYWLASKKGVATWQGFHFSSKSGSSCGMPAMYCASGKLAVTHCVFSRLPDSGLLAGNNDAMLAVTRCKFEHLGSKAVEVRQGGYGYVSQLQIKQTEQGITCYAGAKRLDIEYVHIEDTLQEGIYVDGNIMPAAFKGAERALKSVQKQSIGQQAASWSNQMADQMGLSGKTCVNIQFCTVNRAGSIGLSCCAGAMVFVKGCIFSASSTAGVFIISGCDVVLQNCVFSTHRQQAVRVEPNFDGSVSVKDCQFYKNKVDVFDSFGQMTSNRQPMQVKQYKAAGIFSKLPRVQGKVVVSNKSNLWSMEQLKQQLLQHTDCGESVDEVVKQRQVKKLLNATHPNMPRRTSRPHPVKVCHYDNEHVYYAVGNTRGFDVLCGRWEGVADVAEEGAQDPWKVLLGAAGDIKNVVETMAGWARHEGWKRGLHVVLNDINVSMLVRNLLLLEVARSQDNGVQGLLDCWSSLGIRKEAKVRLEEAMKQLYNLVAATIGWPGWQGGASNEGCEDKPFCFVDFENSSTRTLTSMLPVLQSWLDCDTSLEDVHHDWSRFMFGDIKETAKAISESAICDDESIPPSYLVKQKIVRYASTLCYTMVPDLVLNPTFLKVPGMSIADTCFYTSIYRVVERYDVQAYLEELVPTVQAALNSGKVKIEVVVGDVFDLVQQPDSKYAEYLERKSRYFDVADFTNLGDYVGIGNVLALGGQLARIVHVQMMRSTKHVETREAAEQLLVEELGVDSLDVFAQLSGATLVDFEARGRSYQGQTIATTWEFCNDCQDIPLLTPQQVVELGRHYCNQVSNFSYTGWHRLSPATLGYYRWGAYLKDSETISALQESYPLCSDVFDMFQGAILKECSLFVDYSLVLSGMDGKQSACIVALVLDKVQLEQAAEYELIMSAFTATDGAGIDLEKVPIKQLLDEIDESHVGNKSLAKRLFDGLQKESKSSHVIPQDFQPIVSLLPMVECDFQNNKVYVLFPEGFDQKYGGMYLVMIAQQRREGFLPISEPKTAKFFKEYVL